MREARVHSWRIGVAYEQKQDLFLLSFSTSFAGVFSHEGQEGSLRNFMEWWRRCEVFVQYSRNMKREICFI